MQRLVRDLNRLYCEWPALHEKDCEEEGFSWIDCHDCDNSVISYLRHGSNPSDVAIVVCNFTPVVRHGYRIGVPEGGMYRERLNTDSGHYGGSDVGNGGAVTAQAVPVHGMPCSLQLTLPPLAVIVLQPENF
jgi:1,4-alpha-glucan branching enzyme